VSAGPGIVPSGLVVSVCVSLTVSALALGLYETQVRQPRTPRIAVVDISRLFAAAEAQAKDRVLLAGTPAARGSGNEAGLEAGRAGQAPGPDVAAGFGSQVETTLRQLSDECRCAIVVMAAVIGSGTAVVDYTEVAGQRLGLRLRAQGVQP
jgi:hypothetical protein